MKINLKFMDTKFLILGNDYEPKNMLSKDNELYLQELLRKYSEELIQTNKTYNIETDNLDDLNIYLRKIFPYDNWMDNVANAQGYRVGENGYSKKLGIIIFVSKNMDKDELLQIVTSKGQQFFTLFIGKYIEDKNMVIYGEGEDMIETKKYRSHYKKRELVEDGYTVTMSENDGIAWKIM